MSQHLQLAPLLAFLLLVPLGAQEFAGPFFGDAFRPQPDRRGWAPGYGPARPSPYDGAVRPVGSFSAPPNVQQAGDIQGQWSPPAVPTPRAAGASPARDFKPVIQLGGLAQADAGWIHQSPANLAAVGDAQDGADIRRARLNAHGNVWDNVAYMIEMDFALPGRPSFMDVFVDVADVPLLRHFRAGQWRQPFGMGAMTSVRELTFLERALPFALAPFRQIGAGTYGTLLDDSATYAVSGIRFPADFFGGNVGDNGGYGMVARGTVLPWIIEGESLLHLGAGYSYLNPSGDAVQYRSQPEFFVGETPGLLTAVGVPSALPFFVDTGVIAAQDIHLYSAELGAEWGTLHGQSELIYAQVNQLGGPNLSFPGVTAQLGWFLTGESRIYDRKAGAFAGVDPFHPFGKCGLGAWEIAFRWSHLDLTDGNIQGGRLNDLTAGLNWHLNPYTKFQFNMIHAFLDQPIGGESESNISAMRAHVDF